MWFMQGLVSFLLPVLTCNQWTSYITYPKTPRIMVHSKMGVSPIVVYLIPYTFQIPRHVPLPFLGGDRVSKFPKVVADGFFYGIWVGTPLCVLHYPYVERERNLNPAPTKWTYITTHHGGTYSKHLCGPKLHAHRIHVGYIHLHLP